MAKMAVVLMMVPVVLELVSIVEWVSVRQQMVAESM